MAIPSVSRLSPRMAACCSSALKLTFRPQGTALPIVPARTRPREPHYSALSFDVDALALGIHSGQMPAPMHRLNLQAPVQSVGTCSICRYRLNLQARAQSAGTGSIYRHGLNLQARFERRMLFRTPCGISDLALDPTCNSGFRTVTRVPRTCRTDWL